MKKSVFLLPLAFVLVHCSQSENQPVSSAKQPLSSDASSPPENKAQEKIKINQLGYLSRGEKFAIVPAVGASQFELRRSADDSIAFTGPLSSALQWSLSGDDTFQQADFSSVEAQGEYYLYVAGLEPSSVFKIDDQLFPRVHDLALKAYYLNRASIALEQEYAGAWARPAGHPDTQVLVHSTAASENRPEGTAIASPKGWYDAGDYGKYTVNSGISMYTLMAAYEHFPKFYQQREINIPESNNGVPDILDEVKWNLDWLATMQDEDGSVYHKLSSLRWPGEEMPHEDTRQRYVIGKSTGASLNFAATMAQASRIYDEFEQQFPGFAATCLSQAEAAWLWAEANPEQAFDPGEDGNKGSGAYEDKHFAGEFAWAAAELYLSTGKTKYFEAFQQYRAAVNTPGWQDTNTLAYISLVFSAEQMLTPADYSSVREALLNAAENIYQEYASNPYKVPMVQRDFVWGSNSSAGNKALILLQAYRETENPNYRDAALGVLAYLLGRNPTDYSFITGVGHQPSMNIHHRPSQADTRREPLPGFLAGGPQSDNNSDECQYPSNSPAKSYLDDWCSFSTNEIAINWNAPLVYLLAAFSEAI